MIKKRGPGEKSIKNRQFFLNKDLYMADVSLQWQHVHRPLVGYGCIQPMGGFEGKSKCSQPIRASDRKRWGSEWSSPPVPV